MNQKLNQSIVNFLASLVGMKQYEKTSKMKPEIEWIFGEKYEVKQFDRRRMSNRYDK